jgi:phage shock protein PspC (stress-responsive transcriptional regulator)
VTLRTICARAGAPSGCRECERPVVDWRQVTRRLMRSADDKMLFGVCGGVAERLEIDTVWIRLGFVGLALLLGKGILLYFILAIVMPKADALGGAARDGYLRA